MFRNYFKTAFRNFTKNKVQSFINIAGLSTGMAAAIMIGLWIVDEMSFDRHNKNFDRIVQVMSKSNIGGGISTNSTLPLPVSGELRSKYANDFEKVSATVSFQQNIVYGDKAFSKMGIFAEPGFEGIISLKMIKGVQPSLADRSSIVLSASFAKALFGNEDPISKTIKLNSSSLQKIVGVYEDIPLNSRFANLDFIAPVAMLFPGAGPYGDWLSSSFEIYAVLNPQNKADKISGSIANLLFEHSKSATKPALFLLPMSRWHLYEFDRNGNMIAGRFQFVWLFGIIGAFILLLACINFMNLSTAQSEHRAKEVGIRKTIGSFRKQLIFQFFGESLLIVGIAFVLSLALVHISLPFFNAIAGKQMIIFWSSPFFWVASLLFILFTTLVAGSYPALFLSSFKPARVLKGTFKAGRLSNIPRRVLVVVQFTVSIVLIIGTIVVFEQIQFAKDRPVGYERKLLISIPYNPSEIKDLAYFKNELLNSGYASAVAASSSPTTGVWSSADNLSWKGKDPNRQEVFGTLLIDPDYGKVVEWQIKEGRNFSKDLPTDSACFMFNEAAIRQMNLKNPVGETVKWHGKNWTIIGVVKDMVMVSPFDPITPAVFLINKKERSFNVIDIKLNPSVSLSAALQRIEEVYRKNVPEAPFQYRFADQEYALKFAEEVRIGKLATAFSTLAILISCLGLFGMASFVAEQRTKEIGLRKVLGASVFSLWKLLSIEFVVLVVLSFLIAAPIAWYGTNSWLQHYQYRTGLHWWFFVEAALGAAFIAITTISFQTIKASRANPVKSLRNE